MSKPGQIALGQDAPDTELFPSVDGLLGECQSMNDGPPRLLVLAGPLVGQQFSLDEPSTTLGRGHQANICIKEQRLSRVHASIAFTKAKGWLIRDEKSKNGTFVNGTPIADHPLRYGDRIQLGGSVFLFTHFNPVEEDSTKKRTLEILGRLGAGTAHEFNNLLAILVSCQGYLSTLPSHTELGDPHVKECLDDMSVSVRRASELTGRLLGVAQRGAQAFGCTDVGTLCREIMELVRRTTPRSIQVEQSIAPDLLVVGNRSRLHEMIINLCMNARDAMPNGGTLKVTATRVDGKASSHGAPQSGPQIEITVSDTGIGMDKATREHLFEPFYTTKSKGKGTGLGLAAVLESVGYHGGQIHFETAVNRGTTFHVRIPAVEGLGSHDETVRDAQAFNLTMDSAPKPEATRVLLVDDDPAVRRGTGRLLASLGYLVSYAADGYEGIERFEAEQPDVVLMDLDMPEMGGAPTYEKLRQIDRHARVIFISGHWDAEEKLSGKGAPMFLQKPCTGADLHQAVQLAVRRRPPQAQTPTPPRPSR